MAVIERNMQRMIANGAIHERSVNGMIPDDLSVSYPALDLGEYELVFENERLRRYQVTDKASGKTLEVLFVLYGDLISGWDIRLL